MVKNLRKQIFEKTFSEIYNITSSDYDKECLERALDIISGKEDEEQFDASTRINGEPTNFNGDVMFYVHSLNRGAQEKAKAYGLSF